MKKYITLLSFIAVFFIGMQGSQAQETLVAETDRPEAVAKVQTYNLHQLVELDGNQQAAVYNVFVDLNQNLKGLEGNKDIAKVQGAKASLLETVKAKLKSILTNEQYQGYLKTLETPKK
ncbi:MULTISPECIES: hypothetical protein [unclassified Lacinutrix]